MDPAKRIDSMLKEQYADSKNFMARVELNRRFSTNPYGWTRWVFDRIRFPAEAKVLELGCGNAILWRGNFSRISADAQIVLSDFSQGMLADAKSALGPAADRFAYKVIDAQNIDYPDQSFDIVIANHMLYHVPDRKKALSEISGVLKKDGTFYATTFGVDSMKELTELIHNYDPGIRYLFSLAARAFGLENGAAQLKEVFGEVTMERYEDALEVTEAKPLVDFALSSGGASNIRQIIRDERVGDFTDYIKRALEEAGGALKITKNSGLFVAKK